MDLQKFLNKKLPTPIQLNKELTRRNIQEGVNKIMKGEENEDPKTTNPRHDE